MNSPLWKKCNGTCIKRSSKCNGLCEWSQCVKKDGTCAWKSDYKLCNGKWLEFSEKCNGVCKSNQCELKNNTCTTSFYESWVNPQLMFGVCEGKCLELIT